MSIILPIVALLGTAIALRIMHPVAEFMELFDKPCNRKQHNGAVPLIGGVAVFFGLAISLMVSSELELHSRLFLISAAMMVFIGMLDDKYDLSVRLRLVGQVIAASVIIFGGDLYISNLGNLLGFGSVELGLGGVLFTYLAILAAMNAYNMIDGIDGLLGAMGMISFFTLGVIAALNGLEEVQLIALLAGCALIPFMLCNLSLYPRYRKIFMGDAGSMFVGLAIVWLLTMSTQPRFSGGELISPVTSLWLVAIPIMDMVTIMFRRMKNGKNPTSPDRDHIHHFYLRAGFTSQQTLVILSSQALILALLGLVLNQFQTPEWVSLLLFLGAYAVYCRQFKMLKRKARALSEAQLEK
ncbi:UDP-N-acetylglucosamine--undecaprenyl-phosphate N-acetylglucosaminephosphotransferase [Pseudidiomarina andamanensis]|uniref:Undecaprenyl-phosphate alpha-N-acetylglucosaminyl 1-phosphate transferase n=1 Tax=Pseudidiomarina andamanensis TaxID=1940690 RepID=A0AA92EUM6_9GAMM|nr:UDP-N-acetylglucosamine--undecaprenyl-phosphate N-acetylglucosaminephosphotransferase [Pseudidiomarina andamanensis]MDS0217739.1 UDP-N-acetylglucosamine--undecaprenyl-phosphate N-acetylglucosaminephosphotransferase [Pseudidiomarina andamanensis]QGT96728.1 undecaprenyl-phosphate alpha-N-acetylglucosaminyl 1-phosphate transferase [Pseudidiomarina andamanensis]